jgi:hypothetical protein
MWQDGERGSEYLRPPWKLKVRWERGHDVLRGETSQKMQQQDSVTVVGWIMSPQMTC